MRRVARIVSIVGHPFATMLAFALAAGSRGGVAARSALAAAAVIAPIPLLIAWQRRAGAWETVDASRPRERPVLYAVATAAVAAAVGALLLRGDGAIARELGAVLLLIAGASAANRWVKASLHLAFAAFAMIALFRLGSPAAWGIAGLTPRIAWSRVRLRRHTLVEVIVGAALGILAGALPGWS